MDRAPAPGSTASSSLALPAASLGASAVIFCLAVAAWNPVTGPGFWNPFVAVAALVFAASPAPRTKGTAVGNAMSDRSRAACGGLALVAALVCWIVADGVFSGLFAVPLDRGSGGPLALAVSGADRLLAGRPVYADAYVFGDAVALQSFGPGLLAPFAYAERLGLDPRFASVGGVLGVGAVAWFCCVRVASRGGGGARPLAACLLVVIGTAGWLAVGPWQWVLGRVSPESVVWPLAALAGASLAVRARLAGAVCIGVLSVCEPRWMVLAVLFAVVLWRGRGDHGARKPWAELAALAAFPLLLAFLLWGEVPAALRVLFVDPWASANSNASLGAANLAHVLAYWGLAPAALVALVVLVLSGFERAFRRAGVRDGGAWLMVSVLAAVTALSPSTTLWSWAGFLVFACPAALLAAPMRADKPRMSWRALEAVGPVVLLAGGLAWMSGRVHGGGSLDIAQPGQVIFEEALLDGWLAPSDGVAWGNRRSVGLRLALSRVGDGELEIRLGGLEGEWVPPNPVIVRLNGATLARIVPPQGRIKPVRLPVDARDLRVGANRIDIQAEWARTPAGLGAGEGGRHVSVAFSGLAFHPADGE